MKRGYFFFLAACIGMAACFGCAKKGQESEKSEIRQEKGKKERKPAKTDDQKKNDGTASGNHAARDNGKESEKQESVSDYLNGVAHEKLPVLMKSVSENILLVVTEGKDGTEARFIDISERKVLSVAKNMIPGVNYDCQSYKNHTVLKFLSKENKRRYPIYYIFDRQYHMSDTIDLKKKRGEDAMDDAVGILPGKKKVAYEEEKFGKVSRYELKLGDYSMKKGKKIYQVVGDKTNCTCGMKEMVAGTSEDVIFYLGGFYQNMEEQTRSCYGSLNLRNGKITMQHETKNEKEYSKDMLVVGDEAYFYDGGIIEEENYTKKVYCMDSSGKTVVWNLKNQREGEHLISSDGGKYLVTYYIDDKKVDSEKTIIHIYDRKTREEVAKKVLDESVEDLNVFDDGKILATYWDLNSDPAKMLLMESEWKAAQ